MFLKSKVRLLIQLLFMMVIIKVADSKRPFYNIAHMVNSVNDIVYYLNQGANGIESDISFSDNGTALSTYHGYPCDCFRICTKSESLYNYLRFVGHITDPGLY